MALNINKEMLPHPGLAFPYPLTRPSCPNLSSRRSWLPRCKQLSSKNLSTLHCQPLATLPQQSALLRLVVCSATAEGESSPSRLKPWAAVVSKARQSQASHKEHSKQEAGTHAKSRAKEEDSATDGKSNSGSAQLQHIMNRKQHPKADIGPTGDTTQRSTEEGRARPAQRKNSAPGQSSRGPWQGHSGEQGIGHKRTREGLVSTSGSSSSSSSSNSSSSKHPRTGATPPAKHAPATASLNGCLQAAEAADTPQQLYDAIYSLTNQAQRVGKAGRRLSKEEGQCVLDAAHMLIARLVGGEESVSGGSSSSSSSSSTCKYSSSGRTGAASPILQFDGKQLSMTIWSLSKLVGINSKLRGRHLSELVDAIAAHAVGSGAMYQPANAAFKNWSIMLYGMAKMGCRCRNSQVLQQLFGAGAEEVAQMLRSKQRCIPQDISNSIWAFATAEYEGSLQQLVSESASNLGWAMKGASPQEWANTVWALATLHSEEVELGDGSAVSKIVSAGVEGMVQEKRTAKPQGFSNTLWALATLGHHPGDTNINTLAIAMAERINTAESQHLSQTLWALAKLGHNPGNSTIDTLATAMAERSSTAAPQHLSQTLWALARLGHNPGNATINTLATAMVERSGTADPQALSNTLWALGTFGHNPGSATINTLATAMAERSSTAAPQALSNTLWALAKLGHNPGNATIDTLATSMVERGSTADPQALSNTLWALADLGHNPGNATINTLATAMAERSSTADPQALSNTLWALGTLEHNPGNAAINTLATFMVERSSTADPQALSNALYALGALRWYQPHVYSKLVERLLHSISGSTPGAVGQHFSNALFSCALSCHFDVSVDALAAWGSQQDLQQWTEQAISNVLFAWAILAATAGGDTAHLRALAQQLFQEASMRGAARFTVRNDLGKLYGAHLTAKHMGLPGGGLTDSTLLQVVQKVTAEWHQKVSGQESSVTNAVDITLQGHFEVQAAMVQGYHTLLVSQPSIPCSIAIVVTQRDRDYLSHPAGRLYGKTALRLKHIERGCNGLVLCDESELKGRSVELVRDMVSKSIKQAVEK